MKIESRLTRSVDHRGLKHGEITQKIIGVFFEVYNELGHGFLESVYEKSLELALKSIGLKACRKIKIPVMFRGQNVGDFEADMMVENCVLLELKSARALDPSHEAQLLNYLRATDIEVGMLLNFGLRAEFKRMLYDNPRKSIRENPCLSVAELLTRDQ
jgi:GxxExxY protein